ncbi:MAG TPA: LysM peptidoglycan-binding domain-containing protein [Tepidisphaeraceae bacterium]|jgi:nucleoid-associated protein YgaU|nr:LysM peptidoglycan-binding domain-containing protein [Tepidisphaeraceae bacterium]
MTRETKIGLLVGLAFIIVIGILLSDHLTSTTEPASAQLSLVGPNGREGLTIIGRPSVPVTIEPPPAVEPRNRVVTVEEMKAPETMDSVIRLAPNPVAPGNSRAVTINVNGGATPPAQTDVLTQLAQKLPGDLELVTPPAALVTESVAPQTLTVVVPPAPTPGVIEYTVKEGDSLGRIASRLMGSSKKANQDAIMAANPSMKGDPDRIIVGRVYLIPTGATATATVATAIEPTATKVTKKTKATTDGGTYWYNVKENDNLWKIAADQLGNGNAWTAIKELNKDILKGGETLHTNMRLRLPAKPVNNATASIRD